MAYRKKAPRPFPADGKLCTPSEAAEMLGVAPQTLAHWRVRGTSPKYIVLNARCLRYRLSDIQAWLNDRAQESTAENERGGR